MKDALWLDVFSLAEPAPKYCHGFDATRARMMDMSDGVDLGEKEILLVELPDGSLSFKYPFIEKARTRILNMGYSSVQDHILNAYRAIHDREGDKIILSKRETPNGSVVSLHDEWHTELLRRTNAWIDED